MASFGPVNQLTASAVPHTAQSLTPMEVATTEVFGEDVQAPRLPEIKSIRDPVRALEDATLPALERPPCVVSFSGGRDSSVVLAAAVRAARREGLPAPIPLSAQNPECPKADESRWQEMVIRF